MDVVVIGDTAKDINVFRGRTQKGSYGKDTKDGQEREFRAERNPETKIFIQDIPLKYLNNSKYIFLSILK